MRKMKEKTKKKGKRGKFEEKKLKGKGAYFAFLVRDEDKRGEKKKTKSGGKSVGGRRAYYVFLVRIYIKSGEKGKKGEKEGQKRKRQNRVKEWGPERQEGGHTMFFRLGI